MDQTKDNNITNTPQSEETAKVQPQSESQSHEATEAQPQTSYAVRPNRRHHRRLEYACRRLLPADGRHPQRSWKIPVECGLREAGLRQGPAGCKTVP